MGPVIRIVLLLVVHKRAWVVLVLDHPTPPQIVDTLLIARTARDSERVQIHRALNNVRRHRLFLIHHDRVPLQQDILHQTILVLLRLDDALRNDLRRHRAHIVQVGVPELQQCLFLEPALVDEESVHDAGPELSTARFPRSGNDPRRDDVRVRAGYGVFLELAGYDFFEQVSQAERDFRYFGGGDGGDHGLFVVGREDWKKSAMNDRTE